MISDMDTPPIASQEPEQPAVRAEPVNLWGTDYSLFACSSCGWGYLAAPSSAQRCPHCYKASLSPMQPLPEGYLPQNLPPELVFPFTLSASAQAQRLQEFTNGIPYPPADMTPTNLRERLRRVYIPAWLVDAGVRAGWRALLGRVSSPNRPRASRPRRARPHPPRRLRPPRRARRRRPRRRASRYAPPRSSTPRRARSRPTRASRCAPRRRASCSWAF